MSEGTKPKLATNRRPGIGILKLLFLIPLISCSLEGTVDPKAWSEHVTQQGLVLQIPENWQDISSQNEGRTTFINGQNVFQVSVARYDGGELPNPSREDLVALASGFLGTGGRTEILHADSGKCELGSFGTVQYYSEDLEHCQVWHLSNGKDFVMATYLCSESLRVGEIDEVERVVRTISLLSRQLESGGTEK